MKIWITKRPKTELTYSKMAAVYVWFKKPRFIPREQTVWGDIVGGDWTALGGTDFRINASCLEDSLIYSIVSKIVDESKKDDWDTWIHEMEISISEM